MGPRGCMRSQFETPERCWVHDGSSWCLRHLVINDSCSQPEVPKTLLKRAPHPWVKRIHLFIPPGRHTHLFRLLDCHKSLASRFLFKKTEAGTLNSFGYTYITVKKPPWLPSVYHQSQSVLLPLPSASCSPSNVKGTRPRFLIYQTTALQGQGPDLQ